ncbi:hypothetical protein AAER74_27525, partial [Klebsiella pneumoniae]|uniref:hypothetical protein n=1 Tax=Klebsiella pneumoniae TaxID=573 RepID=UPI0031368ACC
MSSEQKKAAKAGFFVIGEDMIELILTYLNKVLLFALRKDSLLAFFNLLFVASLICFACFMGCYPRG